MRTSYNNTLKSNGIKRIILILLVTVLAVGFIPTVSGNYAYADDGGYNYDNAYYMLTLVNDERAAYGLSALEMDDGMLDAAMTRAYECTYYFSHYRPDGSDASSLDSKIYSENISWGMDAYGTMNGWMASTAHRDNILDSGYESIGVGSYITSDGTPYWVLVFSYGSAEGSGQAQDPNDEDSQSDESPEESGWKQDDYGWVYYSDGDMLTSQWIQDGDEWYYLKDDGYMAVDEWVEDDEGWMRFDSDGNIVKSQWLQDGDNLYYLKDNGYMAVDEWVEDGEGWMRFDSDGNIVKSQWLQDGDNWNYLKADGYMAADEWVEDSEGWMWVDSDGNIVKSKWLKYDGDRYYIKADGYMAVNKWVKDSKGRLWVGSNGKIVKSKWLKYGGNWYYLKADGHVATVGQDKEIEQYKYNDPGKMMSYRNLRYVS